MCSVEITEKVISGCGWCIRQGMGCGYKEEKCESNCLSLRSHNRVVLSAIVFRCPRMKAWAGMYW